jgi:hypothetical protein
MSSFSSLETGLETSRPIETYTITLYTTTYRYTSAPSDITYGGNTYESIAIRRSSIEVGPETRQRTLTIEIPLTNDFAQLYIGLPPARKASLVIERLQRDESPSFSTKLEIFTGSIQSVRFPAAGVAELIAQSIEGAVSRIIPRYSYMGMCNHTLYSTQCGVNPNLFKFESTISAINTNVITVAGASGAGFDFMGGHVVVPSISGTRLVVSQSGNDLTLLAAYDSTLVGSAITCFAGCDHLVSSDCANIFNNVARFGGFPFVPNRNIFTKGLTRD